MFVIGYLLKALASLLHFAFQLGMILFIVRAVLSWFQPDPRQPLVSFIYQLTDPFLERIRRFVPSFGTIDISPLIAILILLFLDNFLVPSLSTMGYNLVK